MKTKMLKPLLLSSRHLLYLCIFSFFAPVIHAKKISAKDCYYEFFCNKSSFDVKDFVKVFPSKKPHSSKNKKKPWTFLVYIAADNNLRHFAARNIKQLAEIGSNQYINILAQIDIKIAGNNKITRRYYIEKGQVIHVNANDPSTQQMDSGDPKTLISCCEWGFGNYPADDYILVLWNHGTGCLDPVRGRLFNPIDLFSFNPAINKFEVDRTVGFIDFINGELTLRGICWDDTTGNYLTNQKLDLALKTIHEGVLKGQKLSIIGFDACLMSMLEVGNLVKPYARYMCGSQEVELGTGWNYAMALAPFNKGTMTTQEFAQNIVTMYAQSYSPITNDYTQSAVNLENLEKLEAIVNNIALYLSEALQKQSGQTVRKALWLSHNKAYCTTFDEPSYKDLHHLFCNLLQNVSSFQLTKKDDERNIKNNLNILLEEGKKCIEQVVLINRVGKNLNKAKGLSIYFPEHKVDPSYPLTNFACTNAWYTFLQQYISA